MMPAALPSPGPVEAEPQPQRYDPSPHRIRRGALAALAVWLLTHALAQSAALLALAIRVPAQLRVRGSFFAALSHWDALNYQNVAQYGYFSPHSAPFTQAFLPGYPFLTRFLAEATFLTVTPSSLQIVVASWTVTALASAVAAYLLWRLVEEQYGPRVALGAVALLLAGPYALFLVAPYPEAVFLAPAIGAWLAMRHGRWFIAGVLAAFAGTIRIETVFLVPALIVLFALRERRAGRRWIVRAVAFGALSTVGLGAYLVWLWHRTGDIREWFDSERLGWHRTTRWPWETFARSWQYVVSPHTVRAGHIQGVADLAFVAIYLLAMAVLAWRRQWPELIYVGLSTVSMATSYAYTSMARESTVLFPLPVLVATTMLSRKWRWIFWGVLIVGFVIMCAQAGRFALNDWSD